MDRLLLVVVVLHWLVLSFLIQAPFIERDYAFMGADGYDYLCNGLYYRGFDVPFSVRPPVIPLLVAGLDFFGLLSVLPILLLAVHHLTVLALYRLAQAIVSSPLAFGVALGYLFSDAVLFYGLTLEGVGLGTSLLFLSFFAYEREWPLSAGLLASLSFATHQLALLFPIAVVVSEMVKVDKEEAGARILRVLLGFAPLATAYWFLRFTTLGTLGDSSLRHWSLIEPHLSGIPSYLVFVLSAVGLPLALMALYGAFRLLKTSREQPLVLVLPLLILCFFALVYDYHAPRFVAYLLPFLFLFAAHAAGNLRPRIALPTLAVALLGSLMPTSVGAQQRAALALVPGVALELPLTADGTGSLNVELTELDRDAITGPRQSVYEHALLERRARSRDAPPDFHGLPALYLFPRGQRPELYSIQTELSARTRTMVRIAPLEAFHLLSPGDRWEALGSTGGLDIYGFESAGLEHPWRILVPGGALFQPVSGRPDDLELGIALEPPVVILARDPGNMPPRVPFEAPPETLYSVGEERESTLSFLSQRECTEPTSTPLGEWRRCLVFDRTWQVVDLSNPP